MRTLTLFKRTFLFLLAYILVVTLSPIIFVINLIRLGSDYAMTAAIGFDQAGGSILYNEDSFTVSTYTYYLCKFKHKYCRFRKFIDLLFGKGHCERSYYHEIKFDEDAINRIKE